MPGIFISYRRADSPDATGRIYDRLVAEFGRAQVFKDVDSIPLGRDFRSHLNDIVGDCAAVLAIVGPHWIDMRDEAGKRRLEDADDFVRIELEAALARNIPVVPVLVGHAALPTSVQLPASLAPLAYRQSIEVRPDPDFHHDATRLAAALKQIIDPSPEVVDRPATAAPPESQLRPRRALRWLAVAAIAIAALGIGILPLRAWLGIASASLPRIVRTVRVTNTPDQEFGPAISPDGKWISYLSTAGGRTNLWVKVLDSGATLNLTASLNLDLPARAALGGIDISPDGSMIAFSARQTTVGNPPLDTWVIPAPVGGVPRKVAPGLQSPRWSPDGKQLVVMGAGASAGDTLWVVNADGSSPREVVKRGGGRHIHFPTWSRDGKFLYFINSFFTWHDDPSEIWRVSVEGGDPQPVVQSNRRAIYPAPLPDGSLIFAANPSSVDLGLWWEPRGGGTPVQLTNGIGEHAEIYASVDGRRIVVTLQNMHQSLVSYPVRFDQPATERALTNGYTGDLQPTLDPKSNRLVFSSSRSGNRNLWLARADGSEALALTSETSLDDRPSFSPDGQQIAFVSERSGQKGIWIMNVEGGAPRLLAVTPVLDTLAWSPDATRILFARPTPGLPELASVSLSDGTVKVFPTSGAAVSPSWAASTNRIAYMEPSQPTATVRSQTYVAIIDAEGRRLYPDLPKTVPFQNGSLVWSPDGRRIAAVSVQSNVAASVWIVDPDSRTPFRQLLELAPTARPRGITWSADGGSVIIAKQDSDSDIVLFDLDRQ